jgi:hypothetical protein
MQTEGLQSLCLCLSVSFSLIHTLSLQNGCHLFFLAVLGINYEVFYSLNNVPSPCFLFVFQIGPPANFCLCWPQTSNLLPQPPSLLECCFQF